MLSRKEKKTEREKKKPRTGDFNRFDECVLRFSGNASRAKGSTEIGENVRRGGNVVFSAGSGRFSPKGRRRRRRRC